MMENPLVKPQQRKTNRFAMFAVAPTAASGSVPRKRPTIIVSTRVYSLRRAVPKSRGMENEMICFVMFPSVSFFMGKLYFFPNMLSMKEGENNT